MATASHQKTYLDIFELSARSDVSVPTIRRYVRKGTIKAFQPGGPGSKLLFLPDALERAVGSDETLDPSHTIASCAEPGSLPGRRPGWKNRASAQVDSNQ